ncbi:PIN domain-containing protein [Kamptonema cortianum]|uniref:PIN domain-containing protein n=1 Tax=Geitlerinema calcuttense NRMC-F 0142 TaxID=2922238 RepID=A0ABT7LX79_9CYAN|nr:MULTISPECIES: PIN domain-containing protein [Cyanophyceae]MDK3156648.1 PIN domain-containing protein [Kamptonema cortianum]MDL5050343.1 PIN domain-containing protein [Oscillatoria amoena NRMC-F 0135]MDL5053386.1 PIN domain-containing protein [Oscillatoria laete-virens NRMC-F 0139]MDL5056603.1 PIN domain-containing protein [Geitlerinema calcuttense NRMC-F 0142]
MFLIDTDILIFALKGFPPVVENFRRHHSLPKSLSVISLGELLHGARKSSAPIKNLALVREMTDIYPVHPLTPPVMETFAELKSSLEKSGEKLDDFDLLIAATALNHHLTLVTNNTRHFKRIRELSLENWAE